MQWSGSVLTRKKLRNSLRNTIKKVKMLSSVNNQRQNDRVLIKLRVTKKRVIRETAEIEEIIVSITFNIIHSHNLFVINYIILYHMITGKIKTEVAILGVVPIWEVGEGRDRKEVVT